MNENSDTVGQIVHYIMKNEGVDLLVFQNNSIFLSFVKNLLQRVKIYIDSLIDFT